MTTRPTIPAVERVPFDRVLVPYDGSPQAETALTFGLALAQRGAGLDILHVVDETSVLTDASSSVVVFDPTPLIDALEDQGRSLADAAAARARDAGVEARTRIVHDVPVPGIVAAAEESGDALVVLGTHGRSGLPRTFLGSTTEGVLRATRTPVLAVHADMAPPDRLFAKMLIAVDDSDPADAAVTLAARLLGMAGTSAVVCTAIDENDILDKAGTYGYDPTPLLDGMRDHARDIIDRALVHGGLPADSVTTSIIEEEPARGIVAEAARIGADLIVMGSHGRRGLRRLFLGSVAEHVVRNSPVPILVVRSATTQPT